MTCFLFWEFSLAVQRNYARACGRRNTSPTFNYQNHDVCRLRMKSIKQALVIRAHKRDGFCSQWYSLDPLEKCESTACPEIKARNRPAVSPVHGLLLWNFNFAYPNMDSDWNSEPEDLMALQEPALFTSRVTFFLRNVLLYKPIRALGRGCPGIYVKKWCAMSDRLWKICTLEAALSRTAQPLD